MTEKKTSRKTSHKVNLNPELGKYIAFIHKYLLRIVGYVTRIKVYGNGEREAPEELSLSHQRCKNYMELRSSRDIQSIIKSE